MTDRAQQRTRARLLVVELERYRPGTPVDHPPLVRAATGERLVTAAGTWRHAGANDLDVALGVLRWVLGEGDE